MILRAALATTAALATLAAASAAPANTVTAHMQLTTPDGPGADIGTVTIRDLSEGAQISVDLRGLPPGQHGFHVHQHPSCAPGLVDGVMAPAGGAGGHWDPDRYLTHEGPYGAGHLGDLPFLTVAVDGSDHERLLAPRISDVRLLRGHVLIIHVGGDNYSDSPKPLGGGGARIACGVIV